MMDRIYSKLENMLDKGRLKHSLGVQEAAVKLAKRYDADVEKASIAGLIHDCAKGFTDEQLLRMAEDWGIEVNDTARRQPELLHAPLGANIACREFSICDRQILDSIIYHTTGRENMTILDKIIYIADYIEPGREFPGVEVFRKEAYNDIDKSVLMILDNTIKYIIDRNLLVDIITVQARNSMLIKISERYEKGV